MRVTLLARFPSEPLYRGFLGPAILALATSCVSATHAQPVIGSGEGYVPVHFQGVDEILRNAVADGESAGVALLVFRDGVVEFLQAHGEAEIGSQRPLRTDAIFRIYSMTKAMTSVAAMMLWEEGKIRLDDPVHAYLPEWRSLRVGRYSLSGHQVVPAESAVTVRDLLRHTSGIPYHDWLPEPYPSLYREQFPESDVPTSLAEFSLRLSKVPLLHQPGLMWTYGASTDVLGRVIEVSSGMAFEEFLYERLIRPLGMSDTDFWVSKEGWDRFAALHLTDGQGLVSGVDEGGWIAYQSRPPYPSGGGGLVSTLDDYLTFLRMLLNGGEWEGSRYLHESTVHLMTSPSSAEGAPHPFFNSWGLGFEIISEENEFKGWGMEGAYSWSGIARTHFLVDPARKIIMLLFQQVMPFNVKLRNEVFGGAHRALGIHPRTTAQVEGTAESLKGP